MPADAALDPVDLRLVVCDMDGTLLDDDKQVPAGLPALLERMGRAGVVFCPASGRQHATLARMFPDLPPPAVLVAENGAYVTAGGEEVSVSPVPLGTVRRVVEAAHALVGSHDVGVVVCTTRTAYVERRDAGFRSHVDPHYAEVTEVPSLAELLATADRDAEVADDAGDPGDLVVVKVAVFAADGPEGPVQEALAAAAPDVEVVVSGPQYVDVMAPGVHKGVAVTAVRERLGFSHDQVAVFGDQLNDAEMMSGGRWSFAVANAAPGIKERATYEAPANTDDGVLRTLHRLLDGEHPDSPTW